MQKCVRWEIAPNARPTANVAQSTVVQDAWARGQDLTLHGWIYGLRDGLLQDLRMTVDSPAAAEASYREALAEVGARARA